MTERKDIVERVARLRELAANLANCHRYTFYREPAKQASDDLRAILTALEAPGLERLQAENAAKDAAIADALAGWRYIREHHGDLYGVGWDRVEQGLRAALESPSA